MKDSQSYSVSELNDFIRAVVTSGFPQTIWVCGEIQQFDRNKNKKHVFFELVEKEENSSDIKARIGLVIFSNRRDFIENKLKENKDFFSLKDDIEVKFECRVDFYSPHGVVRLIVEDIDPYYTVGKLAQEKQRLIKLLKEKGVLDRNKLLSLPPVPLNVGLITSSDSAAYNDFISELRNSRYAFKILVRNTLMQGKKAEADVCRAIEELTGIGDMDLIVITRGGGSLADLSCFDSQLIAEKIAAAGLPVFSGIGHEINLTVTDLAAHTFAKTPTAIAQFIVGLVDNFLKDLTEKGELIIGAAQQRIERQKARLKEHALTLEKGTNAYLLGHREKIIGYKKILQTHPNIILNLRQKSLANLKENLHKTVRSRLADENKRLLNFSKIVAMVHPKNTLKRGFSITRLSDGKIIKSIKGITLKTKITTEINGGKMESTIDAIKKEEAREGK